MKHKDLSAKNHLAVERHEPHISKVRILLTSQLRASSTCMLSQSETRSAELSANKNNLSLKAAFMLLLHRRNSNSPSMLPCGNPRLTGRVEDMVPLMSTTCSLTSRQDFIHFNDVLRTAMPIVSDQFGPVGCKEQRGIQGEFAVLLNSYSFVQRTKCALVFSHQH